MGWFSEITESIGDVFEGGVEFAGDVFSGDIGGAIETAVGTAQDVLGNVGLDEYASEIGAALGGAVFGPAGATFGGLLGQSIEPQITTWRPTAVAPRAATTLPAVYGGAMPTMFDDVYTDSGEVVPTAGALGGAMAAGGIWLGTYLARAFGRGAASAVFTAANGIRVRINQLWPLVRQYGPQAVAGALGITIGGLSTLLAQAPTTGPRKRRRGISARDIRTTKRTIKQIRRISRLAGIRGRSAARGYYHWHRGRR